MTEEHFARGQNQPLRGKVHRHIRRLHGDLDAFKVLPHRGCRVGKMARGEGIGSEQKTEVVLHKRQRNGADGKDGQTQEQRGCADRGNREPASECEPLKAIDKRSKGG